MERPIMTRDQIGYYTKNHRIRIVRRGYRGQTALIDFHTLPEAYQKKVTAKYGDPIAKATRSNLRDCITRDMRAEAFYQDYTPDGHTHLRPEVQEAYVMNASALNGLIDLMSRRVAFINARGGNSRRVWKELADELALIQDSIGCKLPKNSTALKRVLDKYKAEGYAGLICGGLRWADLQEAWQRQRSQEQVDGAGRSYRRVVGRRAQPERRDSRAPVQHGRLEDGLAYDHRRDDAQLPTGTS